jgi:hypothetical protein
MNMYDVKYLTIFLLDIFYNLRLEIIFKVYQNNILIDFLNSHRDDGNGRNITEIIMILIRNVGKKC